MANSLSGVRRMKFGESGLRPPVVHAQANGSSRRYEYDCDGDLERPFTVEQKIGQSTHITRKDEWILTCSFRELSFY